MNYYQVAPLIYFGQDADTLTYQSKEKINAGQVVFIPFRKKTVVGLILKETTKPRFITRDILDIIYHRPIMSSSLLKTAYWMADYYGASFTSVLKTIIPSGIARKRRNTILEEKISITESPPKLTRDQEQVLKAISNDSSDKPHLIFGVTGSGKTEIYLRLIEEVVSRGQQAILLVPEISLTPQALKRLQNRFGNKATLIHSYLKETERFANWKAIFDKKKSIVIGSRSALFSPFDNLGLIIIDEEHETSYKQDKTPRYQTLKVAEKLASLGKTKLVLGSATPSIESYFKAKCHEFRLHNLNKRIVQDKLPEVKIIDMRNEFQYGNKSIFSESLTKAIKKTLETKRQVLLFINRRGMSTFVNCRDCGYTVVCPNCDVPLVFHYKKLDLICHHCGYLEKPPILCPKCQGTAIKFFGTGTQRVEQELIKLIGTNFKIGRMDKDTTNKLGDHELMYNKFVQNNIDVLIGTQMITKGWDIGNVGLVGIISADTMINFPDYNTAEKTFNLLTQVAGRTGRGDHPGQVILQTYNPENKVIQFASKHDFEKFYAYEINNRAELHYPPFVHLVKLMYNNTNPSIAEEKAKNLAYIINDKFKNNSISLLGPSPAFIPKIANKYRWQIVLKVDEEDDKKIINLVKIIQKLTNNEWSIDVDPNGII